MKTCIEEHKRAVMKADPNNAIGEHVWSTGHKIQWDEMTSIDHDGDWFKRGSRKYCTLEAPMP